MLHHENTHKLSFYTAMQYLRNRKHVPCFYRVIQTRVEVWENEKSSYKYKSSMQFAHDLYSCLLYVNYFVHLITFEVIFQKRVFYQVSKREKHLIPRSRRPSGFIVFERLET